MTTVTITAWAFSSFFAILAAYHFGRACGSDRVASRGSVCPAASTPKSPPPPKPKK